MDAIDRKILRILQNNAGIAMADLARQVGLSYTPCWRRIKQLEENGAIRERVVILIPRSWA